MFKRAMGLFELDRGGTPAAVAENLWARRVAVAAWRVGHK